MLASDLLKQELSDTSRTVAKQHEDNVGVKEREVICDSPKYTMIRQPMSPCTSTSPRDLPSLTRIACYRYYRKVLRRSCLCKLLYKNKS
jgi:hypothetical protein